MYLLTICIISLFKPWFTNSLTYLVIQSQNDVKKLDNTMTTIMLQEEQRAGNVTHFYHKTCGIWMSQFQNSKLWVKKGVLLIFLGQELPLNELT